MYIWYKATSNVDKNISRKWDREKRCWQLYVCLSTIHTSRKSDVDNFLHKKIIIPGSSPCVGCACQEGFPAPERYDDPFATTMICCSQKMMICRFSWCQDSSPDMTKDLTNKQTRARLSWTPASAMTRQESTRQRVPLRPIPALQWTGRNCLYHRRI